MDKNTVIFYTGLSLWSMKKNSGAPSFFKTVDLYIRKGWNVYMVTFNSENGAVDIIDRDKLFCMPQKPCYKNTAKRKVGRLYVWKRQKDFEQFAKNATSSILKKITGKVILYAYEVHGVSAAKKMADKYHLPLITRFQGTILFQEKDTFLNHLRHYPHFGALKQNADMVIMTNDGTQGLETLKRLGNTSNNIKFWVNGLDLVEKKDSLVLRNIKNDLGIKQDALMFLTVSRLVPWKRVDRAITLLSQIKDKYPESKLVVVGGGSSQESLEKYAEELGLKESVIFTGAIPHDEVYNYMHSCDIFLSLYDLANVGNPLFESLYLGCCDVVLDGGDTRLFVEDGINGTVVSRNEIDTLPQIVISLIEDETKRNELKENAAKRAKIELYSWNTRMNMEYDAVEKLLEQ